MRRIPREELVRDICIYLQCLPGYQKTAMRRYSNAELTTEHIATQLAERIDNDSTMVITTETVGFNTEQRRGKWGIDEPDPAGPARARDDNSQMARRKTA